MRAYRFVRDMKVIASLFKEERQEELLHFFYDLTYKEKATMENSLSLLHGEFSLLYKEANDERRNLLRQTTEPSHFRTLQSHIRHAYTQGMGRDTRTFKRFSELFRRKKDDTNRQTKNQHSFFRVLWARNTQRHQTSTSPPHSQESIQDQQSSSKRAQSDGAAPSLSAGGESVNSRSSLAPESQEASSIRQRPSSGRSSIRVPVQQQSEPRSSQQEDTLHVKNVWADS
mmetsp:Transcript_11074/g.32121  ORF Transcript_11074/g.32121 Transcript_11074/m.32121 type:complete len:228 (-) Transcript_11074:129-812(-)